MRAFTLLFHLGVIGSGLACGGLPKDEQLLKDFQNHRADLETLVRMFQEDKGLGRVGDSFTDQMILKGSASQLSVFAIKWPSCRLI